MVTVCFQGISKCRDEELEHLDIGVQEDAEKVTAATL